MHEIINQHSMLVEALAGIHSVLHDQSGFDESLTIAIRQNDFFKYIKAESNLQFAFFELLIFIEERQDIKKFKKAYNQLTDDQLRFCLTDGRYPKESLENICLSIKVNDLKTYQSHINNPRPLFDNLISLLETTVSRPSFKALFTDKVFNHISKRHEEVDLVTQTRHPLSYAQALFGKAFYNIADWTRYEFVYVYCLYPQRLRLMNDQTNILLLAAYDKEMTDSEELDAIKHAMKVISDPTRLSILRMIYANPMFGKEIAAKLGLTTATVSHHLESLKKVALIHVERDKNTKYFSANQRAFNMLIQNLDKYIKRQ